MVLLFHIPTFSRRCRLLPFTTDLCDKNNHCSLVLHSLYYTRSVAAGFGRHVCPRRPLMTQVQHWAKTAQTDHVTLRPWSLTLEVKTLVADAGRRPPSVYQVWSSCLAVRKIWRTMCALIGLVTLTFDLLILICEPHQRWGTFLPNLGTLGLWVLELLAMYATDGRTDKSNAYFLLPTGGGIINEKFGEAIRWQ